MEMEKGSASAGCGGTVAMEISERTEPEESVRQRAASRDHRSLIVIGEITTGLRLDAAKQQIAQGEQGNGGVSGWARPEEEAGQLVWIH